MTTAAVVLAAGAGTRFGGSEHKLRAPFRGRPVLSWVLDAVTEADFAQVLLITGAHPVDDLIDDDLIADDQVTVVANPDWAQGQASSLGVAIDAGAAAGHDALVVGLGDQPLVPAEAWRRVGSAVGEIVTATFDGRRRPPVKLARSVWALVDRSGDAGARALMERQPELVSEIACTGNPVDIDTLEDLRTWS
jgi:CTP:molybdopterin cytidylyltransferase MocA